MVQHSPPPTAEFEHSERGKRVRSKSESVSDHPIVSLFIFPHTVYDDRE